MKHKPPHRNYKQMVRVNKDQDSGSSYSLAQAYGSNRAEDNTNHRMRTLDELSIPSASIRKPATEGEGGVFSRREETGFQHQLNPQTQSYFDGTGGPQLSTRSDLMAGTKQRTQLGTDVFAQKIEPPVKLLTMTTPAAKKINVKKSAK